MIKINQILLVILAITTILMFSFGHLAALGVAGAVVLGVTAVYLGIFGLIVSLLMIPISAASFCVREVRNKGIIYPIVSLVAAVAVLLLVFVMPARKAAETRDAGEHSVSVEEPNETEKP